MKIIRHLLTFAFFSACILQANAIAIKTIAPLPVTDTLLNITAPEFTLKDLNGNTIRLTDYKGKILVLDFWATWCVPCRESFPIMKTVISRYKNDPNVKFLFIDTKEKPDPKKVKKILTDSEYPFQVAFDDAAYSTFKNYQMPGIPSKYVIDANGVIRYQELGLNTLKTADALADELSLMIEKSRNR